MHRNTGLIDPLDGTKGFVNKDGNFAINIALIKMALYLDWSKVQS